MALGSYGRTHQRQTLYYHVADTAIYIQGLDFQSTIGNPTLATSIEAMTVNGLDFESTIGNLNIRTNIQINGLDFLSTLGNLTVSETFSRAQIGHDADSFYLSKQSQTNPSSIVRQFTYNNSDFSDRIVRYPTLRQNYVDVVGPGFNVVVENASKLMNELIEDRTAFKRPGEVFYGYQSEPSSVNRLQIGAGFLTNVSYNDHQASLNFKNRLDLLSQVFVSTDTTSKLGVSFTGSEYNPADIVWQILKVFLLLCL